jgi:hypothetical protein
VTGSAPTELGLEPKEPVKETSQTSVTPSGIEIEYSWEPKRQYRLRGSEAYDGSFSDAWKVVPSVTDVLDVLKKDGLSWWGMERGVEGLLKLFQMQLLMDTNTAGVCVNTAHGLVPATVEHVVDLLKKQRLSVNYVLKKAGDRGTAVHSVLEMWANGEKLPTLDLFPPSQQGYVAGLFAFLKDVPSAEPLASEVMVGSLEHGFAGRYDVRFRTHETHRVVVHRTPVRGPQWADLAPGLYLGDLKTAKSRYTSHDRQLEGYEGAGVECGYEPTDGRGVLLVSVDGHYRFIRSRATFQDFLNVLPVYLDEQRLA